MNAFVAIQHSVPIAVALRQDQIQQAIADHFDVNVEDIVVTDSTIDDDYPVYTYEVPGADPVFVYIMECSY